MTMTSFKYFFPIILKPQNKQFHSMNKISCKFGCIGQERQNLPIHLRKEKEKEKEKEIYISNNNIGRIIGYKGERINKLRKLTNAKIIISNNNDNNYNRNRKITIIGFENEINQIENEIIKLLKI